MDIVYQNMTDRQNIHLFYKNLGETPFEAIKRWKEENPGYEEIPVTYAGRLDPMAEGFLLLLSGEGVMEKDKYLELPKTYEFEILWGFETDTLDLLGLVTGTHTIVPSEEEVVGYLQKHVGVSEQVYPVYSSRPVNGKSLFQWAREGRISEIDIPKHTVEMFEGVYISRRTLSKQDLLAGVRSKISLVNGDFRQKEILEKWNETISKSLFDMFVIDKISVKVSSGFYIRQLVSDLAGSFNAKGVTFHIKRTQIGDLTL